MKKTAWIFLSVIGSVLSFFVPHAFAQSTLVPISQGDQSIATSSCPGAGDCYFVDLGNSRAISITGAITTMSWTNHLHIPNRVDIFLSSSTPPTPSQPLADDCEFQLNPAPVSDNQTQQRLQYVFLQQFNEPLNTSCVITPDETAFADFMGSNGTPIDAFYWGTNNTLQYGVSYLNGSNFRTGFGVFSPQFGFTAEGFTITPTTTSSGLTSLSGAQSFCNNQFGTSTGGLLGLGTDFANSMCQVFGFMFIPNTQSLTDFANMPSDLQNKFPFAWGIQVKNLFNSLAASSTANYPDITYGIGTSTPGYENQIIGSSLSIANGTTIQKLAPDSTWSLLRTIMGYMLWIAFAYFVYRKFIGIWHVRT